MKLRDYQLDIFEKLKTCSSNDLVQLDTGAGKTPIEAALAEWAPYTLLVAHRNLLVQQMSEKLAAFGLSHDSISTEHTRRRCISSHRPHGRSYIRRGHKHRLVASMQSIDAALRRGDGIGVDTSLPWIVIIDEAHHMLPDNMWGKLRTLLPAARFIGFTATPVRLDGESLHVSRAGVFDRLVQASSLIENSARALIDRGFLSGYRAYKPVQFERHARTAQAAMYSRTKGLNWQDGELTLYGDPIEEYKRLAFGKRAILMAPAIKNAKILAGQFRAAGIPAACINSTQSPTEIARLIDAFRSGDCLVLTNVDMVGEGFDLPACECLIIATRTGSFPRYRQWCGRVLRPSPGKSEAIIIDLTGMCAMHGMPDDPVRWDLLHPPVGTHKRSDVPCGDCGLFFPLRMGQCPECGWDNDWQKWGVESSPGSYLFDLRVIDQSEVRLVRDGRRQAEDDERMRTELFNVPNNFGGDIVGRTVSKLAAWLPERLRDAGLSIYDINQFLVSHEAKTPQFYIDNFLASDVASASTQKAVRAYKKWQKQQRKQH